MPDPFTIQIFYPNGEPEDMRIAQKHGWTGRICFISREFWLSGADGYLAELDAPGVYILVGDDDEDDDVESDVKKVYIGHAESLAKRIGQHTQSADKSFWRYVVSVTERGSLNIAHFRWMEAYLVQLAIDFDRCDLQNNVKPQKSQLAAPDVATIKSFAAQALHIFPIMEVKALVPPKKVTPPQRDMPANATDGADNSARDGAAAPMQLKAKVLDAFSRAKNVELLERSRVTLHDKTRQTRVYYSYSKRYQKSRMLFWYSIFAGPLPFLRDAENGFLLLAMTDESQAILLPMKKFDEIKESLRTSGEGGAKRWHIRIGQQDHRFELLLQGEQNGLDLTPYLLALP